MSPDSLEARWIPRMCRGHSDIEEPRQASQGQPTCWLVVWPVASGLVPGHPPSSAHKLWGLQGQSRRTLPGTLSCVRIGPDSEGRGKSTQAFPGAWCVFRGARRHSPAGADSACRGPGSDRAGYIIALGSDRL